MSDFLTFSNAFISQLLHDGYHPINFKELDESVPVMLLYKQAGSVFFLANIYNLTLNNAENLYQFIAQTDKYTTVLREKNNIRNIISGNIFVVDDEEEDVISYVLDSQEYMSQEIYKLNYAVILNNRRVELSEKQSHDITNIIKFFNPALDPNAEHTYEKLGDASDLSNELANIKVTTDKAYLTYSIILINAVMWLLMEFNGGSRNLDTLLNFGAMNLSRFLHGDYYRVLSASFLHIGITRFLSNSLSLYIFGARIEKRFGRTAFLILYLISAVTGNFLNALLSPEAVLAGASSGIFGLLGASLAITQMTKKSLDGISAYIILIFILINFLFGLSMPDIGNWAHFGGLIAGYITGLIFIILYKKKTSE